MPDTRDAQHWISNLRLQAHPEGGWYRETYRADDCFPEKAGADFPAGRSLCTAIYFLLERDDFSAFHRIRSDEIWHFHMGEGLDIHVIDPAGTYRCLRLGLDTGEGQLPQVVVPSGCWFASEVTGGGAFSLVTCTVSPGFDFADFEMADGVELAASYAQHAVLIGRLSRDSAGKN